MVQDQCRIFINNMLLKVSKGNNNIGSQRAENQGQRRSQSFEDQMLSFMGEKKRLLNIHEQNFVELATF